MHAVPSSHTSERFACRPAACCPAAPRRRTVHSAMPSPTGTRLNVTRSSAAKKSLRSFTADVAPFVTSGSATLPYLQQGYHGAGVCIEVFASKTRHIQKRSHHSVVVGEDGKHAWCGLAPHMWWRPAETAVGRHQAAQQLPLLPFSVDISSGSLCITTAVEVAHATAPATPP